MSHSDGGHTGEQPVSNLHDPSSQVTGSIYAEITDEESKDATYMLVLEWPQANKLHLQHHHYDTVT